MCRQSLFLHYALFVCTTCKEGITIQNISFLSDTIGLKASITVINFSNVNFVRDTEINLLIFIYLTCHNYERICGIGKKKISIKFQVCILNHCKHVSNCLVNTDRILLLACGLTLADGRTIIENCPTNCLRTTFYFARYLFHTRRKINFIKQNTLIMYIT